MSASDPTRATRRPVPFATHGARAESPGRALPVGLLLVAVLCAGALSPGAASGQEDPAEGSRASQPPMAAAPAQFRVGVSGGALAWSEGTDRTPEEGGLWGLDLERLLLPAVSIRFGAAYGTTTLVSPGDRVAADAYLMELSGVVRGAFAPLRRVGAIPFGTLGVGSLVHDPDRDGLGTASQNALTWGAGLEVRPLATVEGSRLAPLGVRAEWRRYQVEIENVFDPVDRTGRTRHADRFSATLFWAF